MDACQLCSQAQVAGFPLPLVTDENKTSTGKSKTPANVTLVN
jgi:hypothetical protein